jgi:hypothetical protein
MNTKDNTKNIADLLPEAITKNLSEGSLSALKEEFERLVESKVAERVALATAAAETSLDEEVNRQTTELVHKIEEAHKIGLEKVVNFLTEKYNSNLQKVRNYYKNQLGREALKFKNTLVESVSNYINARIDNLVPYAEVKAAVKNDTAMKLLESFKQQINAGEAMKDANVRGAIMEGYSMLQNAQKAEKAATEKAAKLQNQLDEMAESYAFERNLSHLDEEQQNFMIRMAKKAGVAYVNENMSYINTLYEKKLINERKELAAKEMNNRNRNKLQNVSRKALAAKTAPVQMVNEDVALEGLINQIEADWQD